MRAISIQQPWGSLICAGIKDVENRKWALKSTPMTVLIHVGAKRHNINEDTMPLIWANPIENAQMMGLIGRIKDMPTSAVIGMATIERCEAENFSIWAQDGHGAEYKWVMRDVKLFKEPVLGIKGKLGIFEISEITTDNLPECVELPHITRNDKHLVIPVARDLFNKLQNGECDTVNFNIDEKNRSLFATKSMKAKPTESVTFICGDDHIDTEIAHYSIEPVCDVKTNKAIVFTDAFDREYFWYRIIIRIE